MPLLIFHFRAVSKDDVPGRGCVSRWAGVGRGGSCWEQKLSEIGKCFFLPGLKKKKRRNIQKTSNKA